MKNQKKPACENGTCQNNNRTLAKKKKFFRKDLSFALLAFEAFVLAMFFAFWDVFRIEFFARVTVAIVMTVIGLVFFSAMIHSIRNKRDDILYNFPAKRFIYWAVMLLGITSVVWLIAARIYIVTLLVLLILAVMSCIVGYNNESFRAFMSWLVIAIIVAAALIAYFTASYVHYSDLSVTNPPHYCAKEDFQNGKCRICDSQHYCKEKDIENGKCTICGVVVENKDKTDDLCNGDHNFKDGKCTKCNLTDPNYAPIVDPCKEGHSYENGKCKVCNKIDPDYQAPVDNPCKGGHTFVEGKCTECEALDPDYQAPVEDPCKDGHNYENGVCTVCEALDPDYQAPVEDPCKDGHNYENGVCTECETVEPKFIEVPESMCYGKGVTIKLQGIDVDNLIYGNEDFIYVDKISDSEVKLVLVGIVNAEGKVQDVPDSGYITVTDSVSGLNISIKVV